MTSATRYDVRLTFQYPAWDEVDGIVFTVDADCKAKAVKYARYEADRAGHLCGGKGRVSFKATESDVQDIFYDDRY